MSTHAPDDGSFSYRFGDEERVPSPGGWVVPAGERPGWEWAPPWFGAGAVPERMPWWVRVWYHTPLIDRFACEWMWFHGGFLVYPPDHPLSIHGPPPDGILTDRLEVRAPTEADRERFVALFQDPEFMDFSNGVHDLESAHARFDVMLRTATEVPFAKQSVIELATNTIVGYSGVAWFEFEGEQRLEFGYRLVPEARGRGYATEAGRALIALAAESFQGEILAMVDPTNILSTNVITKLGFTFWKEAVVNGFRDNLFRQTFP